MKATLDKPGYAISVIIFLKSEQSFLILLCGCGLPHIRNDRLTNMKLNIPIYLNDEVSAFVEKIASKKGIDRSSVVNDLLRGDIKTTEAIE